MLVFEGRTSGGNRAVTDGFVNKLRELESI